MQRVTQLGRSLSQTRGRGQRGFVTVAAAIGLPLVLVMAFVFYFQISIFAVAETLRNQCRSELLGAQVSLAEDASRLMALNAQVRALKVKKQIALAALAAAGAAGPGAVSAAAAKVHAIEAAQNALRLVQNKIRLSAKLQLKSIPTNVVSKMKETFQRERARQKNWMTLEWTPQAPKVGKFAVRPKDSSDPYPEYEPEDHPESKQAVHISWMNVWKNEGPSRPSALQKLTLTRRDTCGATWTIQGDVIKTILTEDKFFWR